MNYLCVPNGPTDPLETAIKTHRFCYILQKIQGNHFEMVIACVVAV